MLASLRIFISSAWLSYVALFDWLRPINYVAYKILLPFTYLAFFVFLGISATGRGTANYYIIGNAVEMAAVGGFIAVTFAMVEERWQGTLIYLIASPANRLAIFLGRALFNILDGALTIVISFAWGLVLGLDLGHADLPALAIVILVVTLSSSGLGFLVGSFGFITPNVYFIVNVFFFVLLLMTGANIPLENLPEWMQVASQLLPLTRGIQAARIVVGGGSLSHILSLLVPELGIGSVYAAAGFGVFQWFEGRARQGGAIEAF